MYRLIRRNKSLLTTINEVKLLDHVNLILIYFKQTKNNMQLKVN
jgi:hypothetical protein